MNKTNTDPHRCQRATNGRHEPSPESANILYALQSDTVVIEVRCGLCGKDGTTSLDLKHDEVNWNEVE